MMGATATGLLGLLVPETYGGGGLNVATTTAVLEAFGEGCRDRSGPDPRRRCVIGHGRL